MYHNRLIATSAATLLCLGSLAVSPPGFAQSNSEDTAEADNPREPSLEDELDALEQDVGSDQKGSDEDANSSGGGDDSDGGAIQSLNPDLSVILDTGFAWQSDEMTLVGGPDPKTFGFFLQGVELSLQAAVDPYFDFDSHLIATLDGLKVGEAYATTMALPAGLQARTGKFKTRFGRVNPRHVHAWHFSFLPMVNGKFFGPAGLNGLGAEISQLLPLPWYVEWRVALQSLASPKAGRSFLRDPGLLEGPLDLTLSSRIEQFFELSDDFSLLWGLNYAVGRNDSDRGPTDDNYDPQFRTDLAGTDLFLKWKSSAKGGRAQAGWQTEVMLRHREVPGDSLVDLGGYSLLYWQPNRRWELAGRYEYVGAPSGDDYQNPEWTDARHRAAGAVTFFPSEFSRMRLEYAAADFEQAVDAGIDALEHTVILQFQFVTGAHGAHKF